MNATQEVWLPVVGYEGLYEVSSTGQVKSLARCTEYMGRWGLAIFPISERILSPGRDRHGRLRVNLCNGRGDKWRVLVCHLVLTAFIGPRPDGLVGCHNDGNVANNRVENLRWDTQSSNIFDAVNHGTHWQASKTHCKRNHEFTVVNTRLDKKGYRFCRACHNEDNRLQRVRKREKEQSHESDLQ